MIKKQTRHSVDRLTVDGTLSFEPLYLEMGTSSNKYIHQTCKYDANGELDNKSKVKPCVSLTFNVPRVSHGLLYNS